MPPSRTPAAESSTELGSFRDPDSRVFLDDDVVYRVLSPDGWQDWLALAATPLVARRPADPDRAGRARRAARPHGRARRRRAQAREGPVRLLPVRVAVLDAQGRGAAPARARPPRAPARPHAQGRLAPTTSSSAARSPVFVDVGSFERLNEGEPWAGYRQFCMLFLYPLMLQAYKGMPYHALLRGSLDGIAPRRGAGAAVRPPPRRAHPRRPARPARGPLRRRRRPRGQARPQARGLRQGAARRQPAQAREARPPARVQARPHGLDRVRAARTRTATRRPPARPSSSARPRRASPSGLVWDLGCNDGTYSRVAAEHAATVVAVDADHATVDGLYRALRDEGRTDILPLVMSVTDPSPDLGWRGLERARLERRGTPDLALALALIHHVVDHRQRARARVRRLAALARLRAGDRVPRARGPDGAEAALRARPRRPTRTTSARRSSAPSASGSRSSARSGSPPGRSTRPAHARKGPASRRPVGVRLRAAAVQPARRPGAVLRRAREHGRRHRAVRARRHARRRRRC